MQNNAKDAANAALVQSLFEQANITAEEFLSVVAGLTEEQAPELFALARQADDGDEEKLAALLEELANMLGQSTISLHEMLSNAELRLKIQIKDTEELLELLDMQQDYFDKMQKLLKQHDPTQGKQLTSDELHKQVRDLTEQYHGALTEKIDGAFSDDELRELLRSEQKELIPSHQEIDDIFNPHGQQGKTVNTMRSEADELITKKQRLAALRSTNLIQRNLSRQAAAREDIKETQEETKDSQEEDQTKQRDEQLKNRRFTTQRLRMWISRQMRQMRIIRQKLMAEQNAERRADSIETSERSGNNTSATPKDTKAKSASSISLDDPEVANIRSALKDVGKGQNTDANHIRSSETANERQQNRPEQEKTGHTH